MYSRPLDVDSRKRPHLLLLDNLLQHMFWGQANYQDPENHNQRN